MRFRSIVLAVLFVFSGIAARAAETQDLASKVNAVFAEYAKADSPGCALAVIQDGRIAYEKGYGMASLEHGVPITPQTVFDIGSTSKQITAASILLLAQEGKLSLDDPVRKHIPEMPDYATPVTLRHLLHHTSGVRDYANLMALSGLNYEDLADDADGLAIIVRQKKLDFKPGDEHSYSNSGYFLLSLVVQRVSGKTLRDFAQERIFAPLGMTSTRFFNDATEVIPHRATAYGPRSGGGFGVQMSNWTQTGDGGVQTTVEDLAKWDRNFYDPKVGGAWLVEQLQMPGTLNDGSKIGYARGLMVDEYRGLRRVQHGGGWAGYRAQLMRFPDEKLSVITLCNLGSVSPGALAQQVADHYLAGRLKPEETAPVAAPTAAAGGPVGDAGRYTGLYWSPGSDLVRRLYIKEGKLFYFRNPQSESELAPLGGDRFAMLGVPVRTEVSFPSQAAGAPRRMEVASVGDKPLVFQEVQPVEPKPEDLAAYAGTYTSEELDITWKLTVQDGRLMMQGKRGPILPLNPAFDGAFGAPMGLFRFTREDGKKVTGFLIGAGRARDLVFVRTAG